MKPHVLALWRSYSQDYHPGTYCAKLYHGIMSWILHVTIIDRLAKD